MAKFGKRNVVSNKLEDYNVCVLGESGIGKTTLMVEVCQKLFGDDGYMVLNCGKEDGISCIPDAMYENISSYKIFDEMTKDIIKNKETDYPDLKVLVTDTLDQLFDIVEPEAVRKWNSENIGKKDFTMVKTLNQSWGGFGRGEDKVIEIILDRMWELKKVGVAFWSCGHVKTREILDPITNQTYTSLSTNMMQKYFNGIKTKMHVVGIACVDREIIQESTGRKNIVTKKDITTNKVVSESRKIIFRDDNYGVDSKSRFANIVEQIPLNADEFIKALKDAIEASRSKSSKAKTDTKKVKKEEVKEQIIRPEPEIDEPSFDLDIEEVSELDKEELKSESQEESKITYPDDLDKTIRILFKECKDANVKKEVREAISVYGKLNDVDEEGLKKLYDIFQK